MTTIEIVYDDQPNDVIDKVNEALSQHGLEFVDDGEDHDGKVVYELRNLDKQQDYYRTVDLIVKEDTQ